MPSFRDVHWTAPTTMLGSLVAGILFALGHDILYTRLAGSTVPTDTYRIAGADVSTQQMNIAFGNALAFLTKASLAACVSVAYIQVFWRTLHTSKKGLQLSRIDTMLSTLHSAFGFWKVHVWARYPLLLGLAIISWSIPIASIVTPATLSVQDAAVRPPPSELLQVPKLDFTSTDFVAPMPPGGPALSFSDPDFILADMTEFCYQGPSTAVNRTAAVVSNQGRISKIDAPSSNSSWSTTFWGPGMICQDSSPSEREQVIYNYFQYLNQSNANCMKLPAYLSWVPSQQSILPFEGKNTSNGTSWVFRNADLEYDTEASVFVAVFPGMFDNIFLPSHPVTGGCQFVDIPADNEGTSWSSMVSEFFPSNTTQLFQCKFQNASYVADFEYVNGAQNVSISVIETGSAIKAHECVTGPSAATNGLGNYSIAQAESNETGCSTLNTQHQRCRFEPELLRTLSYQGVVGAFVDLVRGTIGFDGVLGQPEYNSKIPSTALIDSSGLIFIRDWDILEPEAGFTDLPNTMLRQAGADYVGLSYYQFSDIARGGLMSEMENMFQNITVSLMSTSMLWPNYTSAYAPERLTNVTLPSFRNIYIYSRTTLWISYSLAIGFSLLSALLGLSVMLISEVSFDDCFSTILRISKTAELDAEFRPRGEDGRLPLPKYLEDARLLLRSRRHEGAAEKHVSASSSVVTDASSTRHDDSTSGLLKHVTVSEAASGHDG